MMGPNINLSGSGNEGLAILMLLVGIGITIFWMVVAWRAMKAHERLADAADRMSRRPS